MHIVGKINLRSTSPSSSSSSSSSLSLLVFIIATIIQCVNGLSNFLLFVYCCLFIVLFALYSTTSAVTTATPMWPWLWIWCSTTGHHPGIWSSCVFSCWFMANSPGISLISHVHCDQMYLVHACDQSCVFLKTTNKALDHQTAENRISCLLILIMKYLFV